MNTHTNKKVICIKDIPSNLIEEAIFILKSDDTSSKNGKTKIARRDLILKETEELVNEYNNKFLMNNDEEKNKTLNLNDIKFKIILGSILVVLVCYLVSLVV